MPRETVRSSVTKMVTDKQVCRGMHERRIHGVCGVAPTQRSVDVPSRSQGGSVFSVCCGDDRAGESRLKAQVGATGLAEGLGQNWSEIGDDASAERWFLLPGAFAAGYRNRSVCAGERVWPVACRCPHVVAAPYAALPPGRPGW